MSVLLLHHDSQLYDVQSHTSCFNFSLLLRDLGIRRSARMKDFQLDICVSHHVFEGQETLTGRLCVSTSLFLFSFRSFDDISKHTL